MKFAYRLKDLYSLAMNNSTIVLPDWRLKSYDNLPKLDFYDGSKHEDAYQEKRINNRKYALK